MSHLLQMRGLKHFYWFRVRASIGRIFYRCVDWNKVLLMRRLLPRVASFTDAWIETYFRRREQYLKSRIFYRCVDWNRAYEAIYNAYIRSHLLQMRGLKLIRIVIMVDQLKSHLLQMRGLKPRPSMDSHRQNQVASFTDAWIETCAAMARFWRLRRIFYRCVDWNLCSNGALLASTSHLLQMRGLKHCPQKEYNNPIMSHLLQMRGLKRNQPYKHYRPRQVASFTDAWIETYQSAGVFSQCQSHLLQMRGLKRPF